MLYEHDLTQKTLTQKRQEMTITRKIFSGFFDPTIVRCAPF